MNRGFGRNGGVYDKKEEFDRSSKVIMPGSGDPFQFDLITDTPRFSIGGYGENAFEVGEFVVHGSAVIFSDGFFCWDVYSVDQITPQSLSMIFVRNPIPKLLVIGTGNMLVFPSREVLEYCQAKGVAVEICNTRDACSTYNFLLKEGREVACALIAIKEKK